MTFTAQNLTKMKHSALLLIIAFTAFYCPGQIPGSLDFSFGNWGKSLTDLDSRRNSGEVIEIAPDGGLIICGTNGYANEPNDCLLIKLTSGGEPDISFGNQGAVSFDFGGENSQCFDLEILTDGRILVAGVCWDGDNQNIGLAKFTAAGQPDPTFGYGGTLMVNLGKHEYASSILKLPNNKFLITGPISEPNERDDLFIMRFLSNGSTDSGFGTNGYTVIDLNNNSYDIPRGIAMHNNKYLICAAAFGQSYDAIVLTRFNTDGTPDPAFGVNGKSVIDGLNIMDMIVERSTQLAIDQQNRIVVASRFQGITDTDGMLLRFLSNGYPDNSFGESGLKIYTIEEDNAFMAVGIQDDGKILAAGYSWDGNDLNTFLLRALEDGTPDPGFHMGQGYAIHELSAGGYMHDMANSMVLPSATKVLLAGYADTQNNHADVAVSKYHLGIVTGINEQLHSKEISISADPSDSRILLIHGLPHNMTFQAGLYNISGQTVFSQPLQSDQANEVRLQLPSACRPGIYLLSVGNDKFSGFGKIAIL